MPYELVHNKTRLPRIAGGVIGDHVAVKASTTAVDNVLACDTDEAVLGVSLAEATPGDPVAVATEGIVVMTAAVSVGPGAIVAVASTNGRVKPAAANTQILGESVTGATAAGQKLSVRINPAIDEIV